MKLIWRAFFLVIFLVALLSPISPQAARAASVKLTPGFYTGKFTYSSYSTIFDNQQFDDGSFVKTDSTVNVDVEGTLTFEVDKKGNIQPGAKITITGVPSNAYYQLIISDLKCNVISYVNAESSGSAKTSPSGSTSGVIKGDLNLASASLQFFNVAGQTDDCQPIADQNFLLKGINKHVATLNKFKTMQFIIVRASKTSISGTVTIEGTPTKLSTPGGFIRIRENGFFLAQNVLSSLTGDQTSGISLSPRGEWRDK